MTKNELKDAAIVTLAYRYLECDCDDSLGWFINKKASSYIHSLMWDIKPILKYYEPYKERIDKIIDSLMTRVEPVEDNYNLTAIQVACDFLYLGLAPNERTNKRLSPIIAKFYEANKDVIRYILDLAYDTKYEQQAIDSQRLVYFYLANI